MLLSRYRNSFCDPSLARTLLPMTRVHVRTFGCSLSCLGCSHNNIDTHFKNNNNNKKTKQTMDQTWQSARRPPVLHAHHLQVMKENKNMTFHCDLFLLPLPHLWHSFSLLPFSSLAHYFCLFLLYHGWFSGFVHRDVKHEVTPKCLLKWQIY